MPAVGDQHRGGPACITMPNATGTMSGNPFEEPQRRMNEYTAREIATLQSRLDKKLGPEYISSRSGPGGQKVHYLSADKCINLANEVFGFNGWSSSIQNIQIDFVEESPNTGKISLGLSVIIRVTLKDGTFHEDIGYGHIENCKGKAAAFEKAKKEGTTDGLKRALRNFGNVLGNCIYDKDYVSKVTKVKAAPARWDVDDLHRHPDFVARKEPVRPKPTPEDDDLPPRPAITAKPANTSHSTPPDDGGEFGSDLFDEADFGVAEAGNPDEVVIGPDAQQPPTPLHGPNANRAPHGNNFHPSGRPNPAMVTPSKPGRPMNPGPAARQIPPPALNGRQNPPAPGNSNQIRVGPHVHQQSVEQARVEPPGQQTSHPQLNKPATAAAGPPPVKGEFGSNNPDLKAQDMLPPGSSPSAGFFSARTADLLRENPHNPSATAFDPHAESPSIRKTAGVDHTKSLPVSRPMLSSASPAPNATRDFINPSQDMTRKIGAPGGSGSGIGSPMNRPPTTSSFRPLTRPNIGPQTTANAPTPAVPAPAPANRPGFGPPQNQNGKRPPLNDVTNAITSNGSGPASTVGVNDPKRLKAVEASLAQQQQQQQHQRQQ
ncbi:hypothetical protein P168DRAFT_306391 [Aspergillus campestris IBT 28561]|uniref:RAD52 homolog n=1 Tax=Aspergillus campestris (strain IBT 28561) TaxID=1392248 RepID=A0A2I1CX62_ASPC2|nr:uncharacterized protein P168DRAFT_306391 [Aspergillus campestris IBT 28561]PKY02212.1 hypothetical protein P168DRAFT_306391 [Aspergillus campestris IBT 28561]